MCWQSPNHLQSVHLTHLFFITRPSVITGNESESEQANWLLSLSFSVFNPFYLAPGFSVYAFTEMAGGIVREKGGFIFSSLSFFFFLCNLLPSETINAHSTSTSRHGFDVYSGNRPLFFLRCLLLSLSLCLSPSLYPPLSLPLPFAHSLRLLYNQIIKRIVDKMILPGN